MKNVRLLFILLVLLLSGCGGGLETKTIEEFYEKDLTDVSKITIVDGNTGYEVTTIHNKKIQDFIDEIKNIKFIPDEDQGKRDGFRYSITLFENDEQTLQFGTTEINGNYYHTDPDITSIVDGFFTTTELEKK